MKKKSLLILALGAIMSLSACSSGGSNVDQTLPTDDPTSPVTITFWECLGHAKGSNLQKIVDAFNAKYQGKYFVDCQKIAGDYSALHDAIKTKVSAGEIPALAMGYPDSFSEYITKRIENSQILRLDNFIKDPTYGYTENELKDFVEGYYNEGNNYQFDGTWSMPMYKSTEVMYYNYSYFMGVNDLNVKKFGTNTTFMGLYNTAAGRTLEDDDGSLPADLQAVKDFCLENDGYTYEVPVTWTEMVTLAKEMVQDRKDMGLSGTTFFPLGYDSDANLMISQMSQRHIAYTKREGEGAAHFLFKTEQTKSLLKEIITGSAPDETPAYGGLIKEKLMITKGSLGGSTYTNEYFNAGQTVMTVGSTGGSSYNISSNFAVKIAPVPYSGDKPAYIQQGPSICFFDNNNPYIHKGAWLFYKELADVDNNTALALENSYDPIRKSCYLTDAYKNWIAKAGQGLKYDIPAITSTLTEHYITSPVFIGSGTARTEIGNLIKYIYLENKSIETALDQAFNTCVAAA